MSDKPMSFLSDFPSFQKLFHRAMNLCYFFERKRNSILIVSAAFLSILLRNLAIKEAKLIKQACCFEHN